MHIRASREQTGSASRTRYIHQPDERETVLSTRIFGQKSFRACIGRDTDEKDPKKGEQRCDSEERWRRHVVVRQFRRLEFGRGFVSGRLKLIIFFEVLLSNQCRTVELELLYGVPLPLPAKAQMYALRKGRALR